MQKLGFERKICDPATVTWKAGVAGATDGLLIEVNLFAATGSAILTLGGTVMPIELTPIAKGIVLPDGRTIQ